MRISQSIPRPILVVTALLATPAFAQGAQPSGVVTEPGATVARSRSQPQKDTNEIVVTARKRAERAIDVPIAVTAISGQSLEERGARNLADVLQEAPGVGIYDSGSGASKITIRGISTSLGANENGYYLDDLPFTGVTVPVTPDVRTWDLDRVEVLRGPQGTLFGEGSMGGTVRILTRGADLNDWELKGSGFLSSTEDGGINFGLRGAANVPIIPGVLAARVAGTHERFDGWIDDPTTNRRNVNTQDFDTVRAKVRFDPVEGLSINGSYWLYDADFPAGAASASDAGNVPLTNALTSKARYELYGANARYDFGFAEIFYGYAHNDFTLPTRGALLGGTLLSGVGVQVDSHELRMASNPGPALQWTIGAYLRESKRNDTVVFALFGINNGTETRSTAKSLFGEATYSIRSIGIDLTAGLRYFADDLRGSETNGGVAANVPGDKFDSFNPRFSIAWHPARNTTIYASAAKGFRSGQLQPLVAVSLGQLFGLNLPAALGEDSIWTYELGAKAELIDRRVTIEGAVFHSDWDDVTVRIPIATTGLNGLINSPGTRTNGVELNLVARPVSGLSLQAGGAYIDADYKGTVPGTGIVNGARVEDVAKFTFNASGDYRFDISSTVRGNARISWQHTSPRDSELSPQFVSGDTIDRIDARLGIDVGQINLALFVDNLTNENGATSFRTVQPLAPGINDITAYRLRPRTFGIEANLRFGTAVR
ncbi:TonB-dependent receptor [Sphingopyxis sp.]|uniref:TonB-dependent receptor n=1 Tax=Sphingopyxis sp. TaxID=1908224 RepID=UPI002B4A3CF7|nr:TonB-dependent receptor [Sphingopyxis sp.]HJS09787.1 TonB-dependent receptor [Sphingopyxis sp.]